MTFIAKLEDIPEFTTEMQEELDKLETPLIEKVKNGERYTRSDDLRRLSLTYLFQANYFKLRSEEVEDKKASDNYERLAISNYEAYDRLEKDILEERFENRNLLDVEIKNI